MTQRRDVADYVKDMLDAIEDAEKFTRGMDFPQFAADRRTAYAVIRALETLGEASKSIPLTVRRRYADVPWRKMAGTRDKLIHGYFGVDLAVVWNTATRDLPKLKPLIERDDK
ncbi:MAG: DUF86 domain-containing protein [Chloroflexi bacterium]|nr:DUF86 domain-containing protein [Chloroflexota bacterium]